MKQQVNSYKKYIWKRVLPISQNSFEIYGVWVGSFLQTLLDSVGNYIGAKHRLILPRIVQFLPTEETSHKQYERALQPVFDAFVDA